MSIITLLAFSFLFAISIVMFVVSVYGLARGLRDSHKDFYSYFYTSISAAGILFSISLMALYVAFAPGYSA